MTMNTFKIKKNDTKPVLATTLQYSDSSAIDLNGRVSTFDFNTFSPTREVPGKDIGSPWDFRLSEVDHVGFQNPKWVFQGYLPSGVSTNATGSMLATFPILGSFAKLGSPCVFSDNEFMMNTAGSCWVLPKSFKIEKDAKRSGYRYSMQLVETKQW